MIFFRLSLPGARWYVVTVLVPQMVRDERTFGNDCFTRRLLGPISFWISVCRWFAQLNFFVQAIIKQNCKYFFVFCYCKYTPTFIYRWLKLRQETLLKMSIASPACRSVIKMNGTKLRFNYWKIMSCFSVCKKKSNRLFSAENYFVWKSGVDLYDKPLFNNRQRTHTNFPCNAKPIVSLGQTRDIQSGGMPLSMTQRTKETFARNFQN